MKDKQKKQKILETLDCVVAAMTIADGIMNFETAGDWKWICWVVIVACMYVRIWIVQEALRRTKAEAETWWVLYQKASNQVLDLAWENEQMRVKHTGEDEG